MNEQSSSLLDQILETAAQRPLGLIQVTSNLEALEANRAMDEAATNLLSKAWRSLEAGDQTRANAFIERALRLPYSEFHEAPSAQANAQTMLYAEIADEVETADTGDGLWLDWALAVLDECEELAALVLKDLLLDVTTDYRLEPRELKRIRAVAGGDDHKQALDRLLSDGEASLPDLIRQVLAAAIQYRQLAEAHDQAYFGIDS